jgi:hypothetical protein
MEQVILSIWRSLCIPAVSPGPNYMAMNYSKLLMKSEIIFSSHDRRTSAVSKHITTILDSMVNLYTKAAFDLIPQPLKIPRLVHDDHGICRVITAQVQLESV